MQLLATAAKKPTYVNESSVAEASASPHTTGTSDRLTIIEVRSPKMSRAKMTVKKGADDFTVSVNETATYLRLTRPRITVAKRIKPTRAMSHMNRLRGCSENGVIAAWPSPSSSGPYILMAPKNAVETICDAPSKLGSQPSPLMMYLLPKSVHPLSTYQELMNTAIFPCSVRS